MKRAALLFLTALLLVCLPAYAELAELSETELLPITLETTGDIVLAELPETGLPLSGTGEPGMPLSLYLGDELLGEPVMSETGRWSLTLSSDQLMTWDDGRTRALSAAYASDDVAIDLPLTLTVKLPAAEVTVERVLLKGGQVRFTGRVCPAPEGETSISLCRDGSDGAPGKQLGSAPIAADGGFALSLIEEDAPKPDETLLWVVGADEAHAQLYIMVSPVQSTLLGIGWLSTTWTGVLAFSLLLLSLLLLGLGLGHRHRRAEKKGAAHA